MSERWDELYKEVEEMRFTISKISRIIFDVDRMPFSNIVGAVEQLKAENDEFHAAQIASASWGLPEAEQNSIPLTWTLFDQELRDMGRRVEERVRLLEHCLSMRFQGIEKNHADIARRVEDLERSRM